jgi:hypothetical protein
MGRAMSAYAIFLTVGNVPYALARCCFKARRGVRERTLNFNSLFKEYTFAWLRKARECSLGDHPWHPAVWRGPLSPRILIASALALVSEIRGLAVDRVARQPTVARSIPRSDFPRTGVWPLRIEKCLRCKGRLEQPECSSRAPHQ